MRLGREDTMTVYLIFSVCSFLYLCIFEIDSFIFWASSFLFPVLLFFLHHCLSLSFPVYFGSSINQALTKLGSLVGPRTVLWHLGCCHCPHYHLVIVWSLPLGIADFQPKCDILLGFQVLNLALQWQKCALSWYFHVSSFQKLSGCLVCSGSNSF